MDFQYLIYSHN